MSRTSRDRAGTVLALLIALAAPACPEPRVTIVVSLPAEAQRDRITVELSVFAPAADVEVGCNDLAFGDVDPAALRSARVHYQQLLAFGVAASSRATASVPRHGRKIALALAAYSYQGTEIALGEAMFAGCLELDEIDGDRPEIALAAASTVGIDVPDRTNLFLSAQLDGSGPATIAVERRASDGSLTATEPGGIPIALVDCCGHAAPAEVRYSVEDMSGRQRSMHLFGPAPPFSGDLAIDQCGPFRVAVRARFQRGTLDPLTGIAYRVPVDSARGDIELGAAEWVVPAQLSDRQGVARHGFMLGRAGAAGGSEFVALDGSRVPLVSTVGPSAPMTLGLVQPVGIDQRSLALFVLPPDGSHLGGTVVLAPTASVPPLALAPGVVPAVPAVSVARCDRGDRAPPLLLGMKSLSGPPSPTDATQPISHYWFVDVGTTGATTMTLQDEATTPIDPPPVALIQSFCVGKQTASGTVLRRLLAIGEPRHGQTMLNLPGDRDADAVTLAAAAEQASAGRGVTIDGLIERSLLLPWTNKERHGVLAAVWFDRQLEVNFFLLAEVGGGEQLVFDSNRLRIDMPRRPIAAVLATGRFTHGSAASGDDELAVIVIQASDSERAVGDLYLGSSSGQLTPGQMALALTTDDCNLPSGNFCQLAREVQLLAADVDGDAADELLLTTLEDGDQGPLRRARVIDLAP